MRSPLTKLLTVVAVVLSTCAAMTGSASAYTISTAQACTKNNMVLAAASAATRKDRDTNGDGFVCVKAVGNGSGGTKDDATVVVLVP